MKPIDVFKTLTKMNNFELETCRFGIEFHFNLRWLSFQNAFPFDTIDKERERKNGCRFVTSETSKSVEQSNKNEIKRPMNRHDCHVQCYIEFVSSFQKTLIYFCPRNQILLANSIEFLPNEYIHNI